MSELRRARRAYYLRCARREDSSPASALTMFVPESGDSLPMTIAELVEAFKRAGVAKQQYEGALVRLRTARRAGARQDLERLESEVEDLQRRAAELHAVAELTLPGVLVH